MATDWPTAQLVHLPVQASWLDQIEIYFSILQRKVLTPNELTDLDALTDRILAFQARYNATATPFDWRFTRTDLDRLLHRIAAHHEPTPVPTTSIAACPGETAGHGHDHGDVDDGFVVFWQGLVVADAAAVPADPASVPADPASDFVGYVRAK